MGDEGEASKAGDKAVVDFGEPLKFGDGAADEENEPSKLGEGADEEETEPSKSADGAADDDGESAKGGEGVGDVDEMFLHFDLSRFRKSGSRDGSGSLLRPKLCRRLLKNLQWITPMLWAPANKEKRNNQITLLRIDI